MRPPQPATAPARRPEPPVLPVERWWQRPGIRALVATAVVAGLLVSFGFMPGTVHLTGAVSLELTVPTVMVALGLLSLPALPRVSYRKRDALLLALVPLYGQILVGKVLYRLLALPLHDWPPRLDERPRTVPVPAMRGVYLLPATFADAEELRSRWCVNPQHGHPYRTWQAAQRDGCTRHGPPAADH